MLANAGGSVADIQGAIELLRSAPDRCQILRSSNRSMRQDFKSVVRGQASQQVAIKRTAPHARWRRDATARLFMVLGSLAGEQGMICCASRDWPRFRRLRGRPPATWQ
jgi:hypothetical protein